MCNEELLGYFTNPLELSLLGVTVVGKNSKEAEDSNEISVLLTLPVKMTILQARITGASGGEFSSTLRVTGFGYGQHPWH